MKFLDIIKTSGANLWTNKGRTILTATAIFIGAFTIALTMAVNAGVNDYIDRQLSIFGDDSLVYVQAKSAMAQFTNGPQEYKDDQKTEQLGGMSITMLNKNDLKKVGDIENLEKAEIYRVPTVDFIQLKDGKKYKTSPEVIIEGQNIQLDYIAGEKPHGNTKIAISQDYLELFNFDSAEKAISQIIKVQATNRITGVSKIWDLKISGVLNKSLVQSAMTVITPELSDEIYNYNTEGLSDEVKNQGLAIVARITGENNSKNLEHVDPKIREKYIKLKKSGDLIHLGEYLILKDEDSIFVFKRNE
jgi:putative ABC transport system permease protein